MICRIAKTFGMTDEMWRRHANPWSVYTRFAAFPAMILAVWRAISVPADVADDVDRLRQRHDCPVARTPQDTILPFFCRFSVDSQPR
jgi:hypothetical protein